MEERNPNPSAFESTSSERDINYSKTTMAAFAGVSKDRLDKENVRQCHQHQFGENESPKTVPFKLAAATVPLTPRTAEFRVSSPAGLQQNLSTLSLSAESPSRTRRWVDDAGASAGGGLRELTPPTRMLDASATTASAGAMRSSNGLPAHLVVAPCSEPRRRRVVKCRRRWSSTYSTPPSASPQRFLPSSPGVDCHNTSYASAASEQSSVYSLAQELSMDIDAPSTPRERTDCINPVAFTLWRGGEEDREWLQEQDRSSKMMAYEDPTNSNTACGHFSPSSSSGRPSPSSLSGRTSAPRQVSSNLRDVYGANYTCEISRPIPMMARRRDHFY